MSCVVVGDKNISAFLYRILVGNDIADNVGLNWIRVCIGPCTFPQFKFLHFYLHKESNLGSIVNVDA